MFRLTMLLSVLMLGVSAQAQEIRVETRTSCAQPICDQVGSKLNRYFRDVKDVKVTNIAPDLIVYVLPLEDSVTGGSVVGYTWAVAITKPFRRTELDNLTSYIQDPSVKASVQEDYKASPKLEALWIASFGSRDIDDECLKLVEKIDTRYLEPIRKATEALRSKFPNAKIQ